MVRFFKGNNKIICCFLGVFFYGFLGCGKTLIVKVIVKEVGCRFINF